jgi:hypothetical protein
MKNLLNFIEFLMIFWQNLNFEVLKHFSSSFLMTGYVTNSVPLILTFLKRKNPQFRNFFTEWNFIIPYRNFNSGKKLKKKRIR